MIYAAYIRAAIKAVMTGTAGITRTVPPNMFEPGVFAGQPDQAQQAKTLDKRYYHRFDVKLSALLPHAMSPLSSNGNYRLSTLPIEIPITTWLKTTAQEINRDDTLALIEGDADTAIQALWYRDNLLLSPSGEATNIVSGMMHGPEGKSCPTWELIDEDWGKHLLRSRIRGSVFVNITQAVA